MIALRFYRLLPKDHRLRLVQILPPHRQLWLVRKQRPRLRHITRASRPHQQRRPLTRIRFQHCLKLNRAPDRCKAMGDQASAGGVSFALPP